MPTLAENTTHIDLEIAKPKGLSLTQLGVPLLEGTVIKKGKLPEFLQLFEDGTAGRRYQNIRITAAKALEGAVETARVIVQFEVFGDENVPVTDNSGFGVSLCAAGEPVLDLPQTAAFLPYAGCWYENQFFYEVPTALFDAVDGLRFTLKEDQVRSL